MMAPALSQSEYYHNNNNNEKLSGVSAVPVSVDDGEADDYDGEISEWSKCFEKGYGFVMSLRHQFLGFVVCVKYFSETAGNPG